MKYFLQILTGSILPFAVWFLSQSRGGKGIDVQSVNIVFKWANVACFSLLAVVSLFMYAFFINKEIRSPVDACYTKAQWQSLLGFLVCASLALTTYNWILVIQDPTSTLLSCTAVDIVHSVSDFMLCLYILLSHELKLNIFFQRTILPFFGDPPYRKKLIEIMVEDGTITQAQILGALERQKQKEREK